MRYFSGVICRLFGISLDRSQLLRLLRVSRDSSESTERVCEVSQQFGVLCSHLCVDLQRYTKRLDTLRALASAKEYVAKVFSGQEGTRAEGSATGDYLACFGLCVVGHDISGAGDGAALLTQARGS